MPGPSCGTCFRSRPQTKRCSHAELTIRDWARARQDHAQSASDRVDNRRMDYIRSLFATFCPNDEDAEARCLLAMALFIGEHFIAADHGTRNRADVVQHAFPAAPRLEVERIGVNIVASDNHQRLDVVATRVLSDPEIFELEMERSTDCGALRRGRLPGVDRR